ncbi:hypothetical protein [Mycobacterium dioxanotrophicus]|uniref:hypothetical protein n=1 Tax=Mycobacterium dioxanotrophicus TaxID=482462 RepID=UPI0012F9F50C|nr:hypothetical protein [Mycobacterium dioxanotrophicus]
MRIAANLAARVGTRPDAVRPIRLHLGGLTFGMDTDEAVELATQLADAVTTIRQETQQ